MKQSLHGDWLWAIVKPLQAVFAEVVVISFFINMLALAAPVFVLQVYDRVVGHDGHATLTGLVIGMVALMVFDFVLRQMRSRFLQTVALRIDVQVGRRLFGKLLALPLATLEHRPAATWQGLHRDVEAVRNTLSGASAVLLADLPFLALYLGLVFVVARPIAWVMLLALLAFTALAWASVRRVERASQGERDAAGARDALLAEMIQARGTVKALSLGESLRAVWERRHAAALTDSVRRGAGTDCLVNVGLVLTTLTSVALTSVGAMAIMEHDMTVGALVAANMLTGRLLGPLNQLVSTWRTYSG
ncbi:MAG: peptidase domain-containing ABC transporter, partial [Rhodospirillales bacterium]|nr:peptidase domain-containing ABC transporter [Rhodospirillales bacterium]